MAGSVHSVLGASDTLQYLATSGIRTLLSTASPALHTYSIIGTPGMAPEQSSTKSTMPEQLPTTTEPASTQLPTSTRSALSSTPGELAQWKVIGIAVISVSLVAGIILAVVFFDSWSAFLRDVVLGKPNGQGSEDLVPDWEKRECRYRLAMEESHRYPSASSLDSISSTEKARSEDIHELPSLPRPTYLPEYEPAATNQLSWAIQQSMDHQKPNFGVAT
ncbi:hypothetical protein HGRIS_008302 [Hohenbuehelia grisea]|uniref:Transmembrane protein n=1 Tax=Hohenbuehelia grisea TaxID=104357 RepID=A0ABR3J7Y1_9AGAR